MTSQFEVNSQPLRSFRYSSSAIDLLRIASASAARSVSGTVASSDTQVSLIRRPTMTALSSSWPQRRPRSARHHDRCSYADALKKVHHILIVHADAAIGYEATDRARPIRPVDRILAARQGQGSNPHR